MAPELWVVNADEQQQQQRLLVVDGDVLPAGDRLQQRTQANGATRRRFILQQRDQRPARLSAGAAAPVDLAHCGAHEGTIWRHHKRGQQRKSVLSARQRVFGEFAILQQEGAGVEEVEQQDPLEGRTTAHGGKWLMRNCLKQLIILEINVWFLYL